MIFTRRSQKPHLFPKNEKFSFVNFFNEEIGNGCQSHEEQKVSAKFQVSFSKTGLDVVN